MSRSGRKRLSKWDLKEEPQLFLGGTQYDTRKAGESVHNKESQPGRHSPQFAGSTDPEWYDVESNNKNDREFSDVMLALHGDGSYSTKMSPGLDDWRRHNHNRSPRDSLGMSHRSRSRSRRLLYGFKQESGLDGRSTTAQTCRDFAAGKCRRGDRCPYLHQEDVDYEDRRCSGDSQTNSWESRHRRNGASKYSTSDDSREYPREYLQSMCRSNDLCSDFIKGKCCRGASCKYAHKSAASDKGFAKEVFKEREYDKNNYASFEHNRKHEPYRTGDIPCKFFAAGNCRKGKFCRFSHYGQTSNRDDRSRDDWRKQSSNLDTVEQSGEHLRWSDTSVSHNVKFLEWNEDRNVGAREQRDGAFSRDDILVHRFNIENRSFSHPENNDKAVDGNERECVLPKAETTAAAGTGGFESKGAENWFDDMEISSPWNCGQSSGHVVKEERGHISQASQSVTLNETSLRTYEKDMTGEMSGQKHQVTAPMAPMISAKACFQSNPSSREDASYAFALEVTKASGDCVISSIDKKSSANVLPGQSLDQNSHSSGAVTQPLSSSNADGQNQQTLTLYVPRGESSTDAQNKPLFREDKSFSKPNVGDGNKSELTSEIPPTQNILSREQISQFTKLSALAQLIGTVQQLPHLGAVPNPPTSIEYVSSSICNFAVPVNPLAAASVQPNLVVGSERLYESLSDSIESNKYHIDNPPPALLPNPVEGIVVAGEKPEIPSRDLVTSLTGAPTDGGQCKTSNLEVEFDEECHLLDQLNPVGNSNFEGNNGTTAEKSKKTLENGALEKMIGDGGADEGKKKNDGKSIRSFKFALAEFVKEILKPKWKEGQISKESHKTIVKKVVDKVTGSIQGTHIPQSQEKIDNYLSSSKGKLTKLVEAYVVKCQKS